MVTKKSKEIQRIWRPTRTSV